MSLSAAILNICIVVLSLVVVTLIALRDRDRKTHEMALLFTRDRSLLEELHQPFLELSSTGIIREWNEEFENFLRWTQEEIVGTPLDSLIVGDEDRVAYRNVFSELARSQDDDRIARLTVEVRARSDHHEVTVPVSLVLWRSEVGTQRRYNALMLDLSEEIAMVRQKEAMLNRERELVEELRRQDQEKTAFMAMTSHELRTPLTSVVGYIEMLNEGFAGELNDKQQQMLDAIDRNSKRLMGLIDDVLTLSRVESRSSPLRPTLIHARDLMASVEQAMFPVITAKGLVCEIAIESGAELFEGDFGQLERVLLNTVTNAVKFTDAPGVITMSLVGDSDTVTFSVKDSGCGISAEDLERVTTRFYRTASSQENGVQGSGLGLSIVKGIVERHGGTMSLSSVLGEGTTVSMTLPRLFVGNDVLAGV